MSGPARVKSMNSEESESESRPVLVPAGNKARSVELRKPVTKPKSKVEKPPGMDQSKGKKSPSSPITNSSPSPSPHCVTLPSYLKKHDQKALRYNLSLNASCSSDASSDSSHSRASTGKITRRSVTPTPIRRKQFAAKTDKIEKTRTDTECTPTGSADTSLLVKKRCSWVTSTTDPLYAAFHDEEWGIPVHDDRKLFELLSFSTALAELTWPVILNKRHMFREVFKDFDPVSVSKSNEKKIVASGSALLSEVKLRAIIENSRQICKITDEFGSFNKYIWSFVGHKAILSHFRYPRQVPIKTSKADVISKDLVKRGFRGVGPTVVYSFMQVAGITNDHLVSCFRFQECLVTGDTRDNSSSSNGDGCGSGGSSSLNKTRIELPEETQLGGLARAIADFDLTSE